MALARDRERQARQPPPAVHPHRAGTTRALVTTLLRPCQPEMLAQRVQEADARLDSQRPVLTVDGQRDRLRRGSAHSRWRGDLAIHGNPPFLAHPDVFTGPASAT